MQERLDREQPGEQRYKDHADYGYTSAGHELLHALGFCTGVVVAVTFEQVDDTPNAQTGTQSDNESLKNAYCRGKKCHKFNVAESKKCIGSIAAQTTELSFQLSFQKF